MCRSKRISLPQLTIAGLLSLLGVVDAHAQELGNTGFDCLIEPKMTVMVGAPTQGVIESIDVERNQSVEPGQLLATLRSDVEQAALDHARVRATMKSEIQARAADLKLAQVNMERIKELFAKQMVPSQQRDEAVAQLEVARMAVRQAEDNKTLYEYEFSRARQILSEHQIRSPIAGVVVEQRAFPGEFVYENPVVTIAQLDPLRVEAILPARYFGKVAAGMMGVVAPEIDLTGSMTIAVTATDRLIDAASGTFLVHLDLPNPDHLIPGGQRCTLTFSGDEAAEQLADVSREKGGS